MNRDDLYRRFGPKLIDALAQVLLDEVNLLRENAGLSPRSGSQVVDAITNKLEGIPDYDWMNKEL
jgi:hypothetical protein